MHGTPARPALTGLRDVRLLRLLAQALFLIAAALLVAAIWVNVRRNLQQLGVPIGLDFLRHPASFAIGESPIAYRPTDPYLRAYMAGLANTLRVAVAGIVLATVLGVVAGVARLSANALVRGVAAAYVEAVRNTPLLLQLFFWHGAVILRLPAPQQALRLPGPAFLSNRGLALPAPEAGPGLGAWAAAAGLGLVAAAILYRHLARLRVEQGRETRAGLVAAGVCAAGALAGAWLAPGPVLAWSQPALVRFNFQGGALVSPEYATLLVGLVVYTAAFIAEVVRGGLLAVSRGQWEAARALGLPPPLVLRLVVFPQALRVIIPPLTSQYLNLIKNSSLAIAVAYPDVLNVSSTIVNQTGRTLEMLALVGLTYLAFSLVTSLLMNLYNRARRGVG